MKDLMDKIFSYQSFLNQYYSVDYSLKENVDEDSVLEDDDISDPKLKLQKKLIESMFLKNEEEKKSKSEDKVEISDLGKKLSEESKEIDTPDEIESISITYERFEYRQTEIAVQEQQVAEAEPLVLDLNGNGLELTDIRKGEGVSFDITGNGVKEEVSWAKATDGFLVYDRNGNGNIDSGKELFGDQHGAANGFEELSKFDSDSNGVIDKEDSIYNELKVWQDLNQNGVSEENELKSLNDLKIDEISLENDGRSERLAGNRIEGYSNYTQDSVKKEIGEVFLNYLV